MGDLNVLGWIVYGVVILFLLAIAIVVWLALCIRLVFGGRRRRMGKQRMDDFDLHPYDRATA